MRSANPSTSFEGLVDDRHHVDSAPTRRVGGRNSGGALPEICQRPPTLDQLDPCILCRLWPPQRLQAGLRCSKWLRAHLAGMEEVSVSVVQGHQRNLSISRVRGFCRQFENPQVSATLHANKRMPEMVVTVLHGYRRTILAPALVELSLGYCSLGGHCAGPVLSDVLSLCTNLEHLNLMGNKLGPAAGMQVASALSTTKLVSLNLAWNLIGQKATEMACQSLKECTSITLLDLGGNNITGASAVGALAAASSGLRTLDLGRNRFDRGELLDLLAALRAHTEMRRLVLRSCNIGNADLQVLLDALDCCKTLQHLDLRHHHLDDEGVQALATAVASWPDLSHLDLSKSSGELGEMGVFPLLDVLAKRRLPVHVDVRYAALRGTKMGVYDAMFRGCLQYGRWEPRGKRELGAACKYCQAIREFSQSG